MKVLGIIPARGGSKGIPGKNRKLLLGKPLIAYTIEAALRSKLAAVVISTDDDEIEQIGINASIRVIKRPSHLSQDDTPTLPVLQHVLENEQDSYDAIMTLQPTSPLRTFTHIDESIKLFAANGEADSLVSVVKVPHNFTPVSLMMLEGPWLKHYSENNTVLRRQDKPVYLARNGAAIYITKTGCLDKFILGGNILPYEMNKIESIDIDDMEDWRMVEALLNRKS